MATQAHKGYQLEVSLDASQIEDRRHDQVVKVLVQGGKGPLASELVKFDDKGHGITRFSFAELPGGVRVILGPEQSTDEELLRLNTIGVDIPARQWAGQSVLKLGPISISPYYWYWLGIWCRTFIICGRVVCPDGSPVAGATVCAYDVDWWWWYSSTQQIACATTDITGSFCMKFRWCCGWWPWWWWESRFWQLDPVLIDRIVPVLQRNPDLLGLIQPKTQPSLNDFRELLGPEAAHLSSANAIDPAALARLRDPMLRILPAEPELERNKIWPWYPWQPPWNDCNPDVIFKVTQNCSGVPNVIVNETIWDTRWNIPTSLNETLIANEKACCVAHDPGCPGDNCIALTTACGATLNYIGGNYGAPPVVPSLIGYADPNGSGIFSDRPFGGVVPIAGIAHCLDGIDYYEFEWATSSIGPWNPMPPNANGTVTRTYWDSTVLAPANPYFPIAFAASPLPSTTAGIRNVFQTPQHYEANNSPASWALPSPTRAWVANYDQLINRQTFPFFSDGTYYLRLKGWKYNVGTNQLESPNILDICGSNPLADNYVVLRVDNRVVSVDPHGNPCGGGNVHTCTNEPDTALISIKILKGNGSIVDVLPCGSVEVSAADTVAFEFAVYDHDGHLAQYDLSLHYGTYPTRALLPLAPTLIAGNLWQGVPPAAQVGWDYVKARTQGAGRPTWNGGTFHLEMPATGPNGAFPVTCCYLLRLDAYKRNIVDCNNLYRNISETTFTITVVP